MLIRFRGDDCCNCPFHRLYSSGEWECSAEDNRRFEGGDVRSPDWCPLNSGEVGVRRGKEAAE